MITFVLIALLSAEPIPTFVRLGSFDTMAECREFIATGVKPEHRASMECLAVVHGYIGAA